MKNEANRNPEAMGRIEVVGRLYEHLGRGDVAALLALLHPGITWTEAEGFPYYAGTSVGPDAVHDNLLKRLAQEWDGFVATPKDYLTEGLRVVSFGTYEGRYRRTGKSLRADFAHVWTVDDGKITDHLAFTDTVKFLHALAA